ncbi:MAG: hypothetical protein HC869_01865 [Rhodospirillales bacterium]|nr:hypothetical protein [Rhodospirillales bacterium]
MRRFEWKPPRPNGAAVGAIRRVVTRWPFLRGLRHLFDRKAPIFMGVWQIRSPALGLGVALLAVGAALFARLVLLGDLGTRLAYITLYPAVTIAAAECGRQRLFIDQFCRLAQALNCQRDDLLTSAMAQGSEQKPATRDLASMPTVARFVQKTSQGGSQQKA